MRMTMEDDIKRWTAKRKAALVMEIIQGKSTVAEASRAFDLAPSEIETWVDEAKRGMENALRAKPMDIREQYEKQLKSCRKPTAKPCWSCSLCWATTSSPSSGRDWQTTASRCPSASCAAGLTCRVVLPARKRPRPSYSRSWSSQSKR